MSQTLTLKRKVLRSEHRAGPLIRGHRPFAVRSSRGPGYYTLTGGWMDPDDIGQADVPDIEWHLAKLALAPHDEIYAVFSAGSLIAWTDSWTWHLVVYDACRSVRRHMRLVCTAAELDDPWHIAVPDHGEEHNEGRGGVPGNEQDRFRDRRQPVAASAVAADVWSGHIKQRPVPAARCGGRHRASDGVRMVSGTDGRDHTVALPP